MTLDENISQLRDALTVTSAMTLRHETLLKDRAEWLQAHDRAMLELDARMVRHQAIMERVELGLAEATDKLNALIDIVDDRHKSS